MLRLQFRNIALARTSLARNSRLSHALPNAATSTEPPPYLNIKLPDLSAPLPETEVQIPFTPDFWESSRAKAEAAPTLPEEPQVPKVILVAGDLARADSVSVPIREHVALIEHPAESSSSEAAPNVSNLRSLFLDIADDLVLLPKDLGALKFNKSRLPQPDDLIDGMSTSIAGSPSSRFHTRTLDTDEVRGLWIIFGLFAGSWLAGGLFKKEPKYAESV